MGATCSAGGDFGEMVATRRGSGATPRMAPRQPRERTGVVLACACPSLVPVLNLLAPMIATAAVTHLYQGRRAA